MDATELELLRRRVSAIEAEVASIKLALETQLHEAEVEIEHCRKGLGLPPVDLADHVFKTAVALSRIQAQPTMDQPRGSDFYRQSKGIK